MKAGIEKLTVDKEAYERDGYCLVRGVFSREETMAYIDHYMRINAEGSHGMNDMVQDRAVPTLSSVTRGSSRCTIRMRSASSSLSTTDWPALCRSCWEKNRSRCKPCSSISRPAAAATPSIRTNTS